MKKSLMGLLVFTVLISLSAGALTACNTSLGNTSWYCVSLDGSLSQINFQDGERWYGTDDGRSLSGTWSQDGDTVILALSGATRTLTTGQDDRGKTLSFTDSKGRGFIYYGSLETAQTARDRLFEATKEEIKAFLSGETWETEIRRSGGTLITPSQTEPEAIRFEGDSFEFSKGTYNQARYIFKQQHAWEWAREDHSGTYDITSVSEAYAVNGDAASMDYAGELLFDDGRAAAFKIHKSTDTGRYGLTLYDIKANGEADKYTYIAFMRP